MKTILIALLILFFGIGLKGQEIEFADSELERYLLTEECADITGNGLDFINPDTNQDGAIQLLEALAIKRLDVLDAIPSDYFIKSFIDLEHFLYLEELQIYSLDSLIEIDQPDLSTLHSFVIQDCLNLKYLDLSNLPGLTQKLHIIGSQSMDYLNIQNGTVAQNFTMFYTINTQYACIDSIASEYDELINAGAMANGVEPVFDCETVGSESIVLQDNAMVLFPNPADNFIQIKSEKDIRGIEIFTASGNRVLSSELSNQSIDISSLQEGVYFMKVKTENNLYIRQFIKL